jgi:hypothetical protein
MRQVSVGLCVLLLGLTVATPAKATTVVYTVTGTGEARTQNLRREFLPDGSVLDTNTDVLVGTGGFTATYRIDLANLPANSAGPDYHSIYTSTNGTPNFLTSQTIATIGGQSFGLTTNGFNSANIRDGKGITFDANGFPTISTDSIGTTGPLHNLISFTYYASGATKSRTDVQQYNEFYDFSGGSFLDGGVSLPGFNRGGSQQIIFGESTLHFAEAGGVTLSESFYRTFLGNGSVSITTLTAAVPEPQSWALMLVGFGLIGGMVRRRGEANLTPPATSA